MEAPNQGTFDEVLALKQFLQGMLLTDQDGETESSLPVPGKGVIRNDHLLELMGVSTSEVNSSSRCSAYSLEDERPAAVAPLQILSPRLSQQQQQYHVSKYLEPQVAMNYEDRADKEEGLLSEMQLVDEDSPRQSKSFFGTRINKTSAELLRRSATFEPDFQTRMKQFLLKNQQKKERIRQSLTVKEDPDVAPIPRINRRSKCIPRNVSHLLAWNYEKESKLARIRDAETAKQEATCVGKPSISKRSVLLFSKRQDEVAHCKVEDRLHLLGLIYQYQQEERKRVEERQASSSVQPQLAPHSANAQRRRHLSVHERLYQLSKRNTNNNHEHCASKTAGRERRANDECIADTVERLHALGKEYKQKQLLLSEERKQHFENLRKAPKMSARSRKLAAKKKKNLTPKSPLRCGCCGGKEDKEGKCGCTIEPRVNSKHAADIYERQLRWKNANETRHSQQRQLKETLALTECTFRNPFYQKAWNSLDDRVSRSTEDGGKDVDAAFFKRCALWAEKRDRQVAREKKAVQERQLEECTFMPRITARTPKYLAVIRGRSNQQDEASTTNSPALFVDCSVASSPPERREVNTEKLFTQLYSALDLRALVGELSPEHHSVGSNDEGAHGFPKYTFTDFGEFAGR
ncbi:hypothetical protein KRP22_008394 [Phytophthora ramorum]|uniref:uncharacterized protein n=1 Tax=Phytophthora ramorum TaxID=164328 RepID=UPI0030956556|nr:hypothetical protein KRP23_14786 [Phytophthora ramorum]KAH7505620.1 hypothetical protein KRP22_3593 [Phytophthora ramorum]